MPEHLWEGEGREAEVGWCEEVLRFLLYFYPILNFLFLYLQGEINVSGRVGSKQTRQIFLPLVVVVASENGDGRGMDEGVVAAVDDPTRVPRRRRLRKEASIILIR